MSGPRVPRDTCGRCGEYLPHYCAAIVVVRRERFGRKTVTVTDRQPAEAAA
jgi:NMD protein affecting ribosome stability and mRNA decay